jgi:hypothetical protein
VGAGKFVRSLRSLQLQLVFAQPGKAPRVNLPLMQNGYVTNDKVALALGVGAYYAINETKIARRPGRAPASSPASSRLPARIA